MTIKVGDFVILKKEAAQAAGFAMFTWKWAWEVINVEADEFGTTFDLKTAGGHVYAAFAQDCVPYVAPEIKWGSPVSGNHDPMDYADCYDGCEEDND